MRKVNFDTFSIEKKINIKDLNKNAQSKTFNINNSLYDNKANINASKTTHIDYTTLQNNIRIKKDDKIIFNGN